MKDEKFKFSPICQFNTVEFTDEKDSVRNVNVTFLDIRYVLGITICKPHWVKEDDSRTYMEIDLINGYHYIGIFDTPESVKAFIESWELWANANRIAISTMANSRTPSA